MSLTADLQMMLATDEGEALAHLEQAVPRQLRAPAQTARGQPISTPCVAVQSDAPVDRIQRQNSADLG